jgi:hypothetical protein
MWCGRPGRLGPGRSVGAFLEGALAELHGRTVMQGRVRSKAGPGLQPVKSSVPSSAAGDRRHNASARLADLTAQGGSHRHDNLGASLNLYSLYRSLNTCKWEGGTRR